MKLLIITNLFPNSFEPTRGIFNFQQFKALRGLGVEMKVIAPVPWHHFSSLPLKETIDGFEVYHPRYFMIPKVGRALYGVLFFLSVLRDAKQIDETFRCDSILATWAYPDGVGSFLIAKWLKKPIVIKVHGSDVNLYHKYPLRRGQIRYALAHSHKVVAVSNALKEKLTGIGVPAEKIVVIPNGVDTDLFKPMDQAECRKKLGLPLDKKIVLYVGNFAYVKGVDVLVEAFARVKQGIGVRDQGLEGRDQGIGTEMQGVGARSILLLVGDGPMEALLRARVKDLGIEDAVIFAGRTTHDAIRYYMNAADVFCLPSRDEGCPNVVLEALACGTLVVASNVGGIPDLLDNRQGSTLVEVSGANALAVSLTKTLQQAKRQDAISDQPLSWHRSAELLREAIASSSGDDVQITLRARVKFLLASFFPSSVLLVRGKTREKKIALTFDDGPHPVYTKQVLDILKAEKNSGDFFSGGGSG